MILNISKHALCFVIIKRRYSITHGYAGNILLALIARHLRSALFPLMNRYHCNNGCNDLFGRGNGLV